MLDHADLEAPTRQHEVDHTDQELICPEISKSSSGNRRSVRCVTRFCGGCSADLECGRKARAGGGGRIHYLLAFVI